jgi:hypothetical protein
VARCGTGIKSPTPGLPCRFELAPACSLPPARPRPATRVKVAAASARARAGTPRPRRLPRSTSP